MNTFTSADGSRRCSRCHLFPDVCSCRTLGHPLILGRDGGGLRHFVDDKPVHCGTTLELQCIRYEYDVDTDEEHYVPIDEWVRVRYEASLFRGEDCKVTLHTNVGGHGAVLEHWDYMRFRWPERD